MSYDHMTVDRLEEGTAKYIAMVDSHIETMDEDMAERRRESIRRLDGIPVRTLLAFFCEEVRKVYKHIKFGVPRRPEMFWENGVSVACEVYAYFEGDTYAPIRLGYKPYSASASGSSQYGVYARCIRNEKYREDREQYYMAMADGIDRALRNVKKNLRPYRVEEVAGMSLGGFTTSIGSIKYDATQKVMSAKREVTEHAGFIRELRHLIETGHEFVDSGFKGLVVNMLQASEEHKQMYDKQHHGYYVAVRNLNGEQVFDIITVLDVTRANANNIGAHKTCTVHELPEGVPEKMATLSMIDGGRYIDGLGFKVNDTSYWVLA